MTSAETHRAREVYRYYQPKSLAKSSEHLEESQSANAKQQEHAFLPSTNFTTQTSFSDTALTAFAQLIALRLASQRAIVSLIDHENEYFLAESTSTLSLIDDDEAAQNAWLSISGASVPRGASLCEQTLCLVPNQDTTAEMTPWCLVPDLRLHEKMSQLECVKGPPYLRFYCGVALTNLKGINIGCVYVVDDRPRTDFSLEQAQFLTKMAATVMDHLEGIRAKEDIVRVTMMSQALHAFIEGDGTMDGDWQRLKRYNLGAGGGVGFSWESNKVDGISSGKQVPASQYPMIEIASPVQSPLQHTGSNSTDARFNFNNSPWSSSSDVQQMPKLKSVFEEAQDAVTNIDGGRDTEFTNNGFFNLLHDTFSRASNLVREGMEVDGAVFFDAPFRFYQGRSTLETDTRVEDPKESGDSDSDDEGEEDAEIEVPHHSESTRPGPHPHVLPSSQRSSYYASLADEQDPRAMPNAASMGIKSDILGYSTKRSSSWKNPTGVPDASFEAIDQSLLTSLVRRYPHGELFVFDHDGPISPPEPIRSPDNSEATLTTVATGKRIRHRARKRAEILRLLAAFPQARQIFFVPLYDATSGCFIGSFAWSTSLTRIFSTENHLSYMIAFGHSVMSEVSRLNTVSADHAKGDFISNVSHELRSPLHGILASIEFLADTALDGFQRNLVDTVDICGRTLLDTIEHVLDFSKIKKFGQDSVQSMGVVADLDVSAVIEEVLEGVYAGFEFNGLSSEGLADTTKSRSRGSSSTTATKKSKQTSDGSGVSNDLLTVIIDIDFRDQGWKFPTVPGTWRRLTMNVFGNSLKYTNSGFIKVKLESKSMPAVTSSNTSSSARDTIERTMVTLTITDSGRGMSSDFMRTKLFMPFSQEDITAPGTGLGMSIVKEIVDKSGGIIDVRSDPKTGTEIKLSLPLEQCIVVPEQSSDSMFAQEGPVDSVRRRAGGRTISIHGFDNVRGKSDVQLRSLASLKASIQKYSTDWFALKFVPSDQTSDIAIADESALSHPSVSLNRSRILLVICSNGSRKDLYPSQIHGAQIIEFVSKPCGPHRLAKALLNCLDAEDATPQPTPLDRVSSHATRAGPASPDEALVTAGSSSTRLIGNLQSSIGFSPTTLNIKKPGLPEVITNTSIRPSLVGRMPSVHEIERVEESPSWDKSSASNSNAASGISSDPENPNSSTSQVENGNLVPPRSPIPRSPSPVQRPNMLLVEDNPINMMLLATYMKKNNWKFEKATNGLLALEAFQERPEGFDVIFMDVSMPIMTGYESTRHIRTVELERRLAYEHQNLIQTPYLAPSASASNQTTSQLTQPQSFPFFSASNSNSPSSFSPSSLSSSISAPRLKPSRPALIIALTGLSSQKDQEMAFEAGVDIFMTKPVRFREVGRILEGWMKSREAEGEGKEGAREGKERREVDEMGCGAKRSG